MTTPRKQHPFFDTVSGLEPNKQRRDSQRNLLERLEYSELQKVKIKKRISTNDQVPEGLNEEQGMKRGLSSFFLAKSSMTGLGGGGGVRRGAGFLSRGIYPGSSRSVKSIASSSENIEVDPRQDFHTPINILCLDGGGMKGNFLTKNNIFLIINFVPINSVTFCPHLCLCTESVMIDHLYNS